MWDTAVIIALMGPLSHVYVVREPNITVLHRWLHGQVGPFVYIV